MAPNTILIVEDSSDDLFFLKDAFKKAALSNPLEVVTSGEAGLNFLIGLIKESRAGEAPILPLFMMLDLALSEMNGFEVLERIRKMPELAKFIVIVLTSSEMNSDVLLAYELGARSYLVKPPDPRDLIAIVKAVHDHALGGWLPSIELPGQKMRPRN
jgi:CheY-like chemotaxis protein